MIPTLPIEILEKAQALNVEEIEISFIGSSLDELNIFPWPDDENAGKEIQKLEKEIERWAEKEWDTNDYGDDNEGEEYTYNVKTRTVTYSQWQLERVKYNEGEENF